MAAPGPAPGTRRVCFTVDLEQDCPPYLDTFRGMDEGVHRLLELLREERIPATFFATGQVAERYAGIVRQLVADGHELGCHGHTHRRFGTMTRAEARAEIEAASAVLRCFAPVASFRAPNLDLPERLVDLLPGAGYRLDSSQARYKLAYYRSRRRRDARVARSLPKNDAVFSAPPETRSASPPAATSWTRADAGIVRVPASVTSSVLRLPRAIRDPWLDALASPVVLFVHPWEFVDLRRERLRFDCRFRTGPTALGYVRSVLCRIRERGDRFCRLDELLPGVTA